MPGIDPSVIVHRLNVLPSFPPIQQKKQVFALERDQTIAEEVRKLQEASFIREVYYPPSRVTTKFECTKMIRRKLHL